MARYDFKILKTAEILTHSPYSYRYRLQDRDLTASIKRFGILMPLVATTEGRSSVIAGHRRFFAARGIELREIPVLLVGELSPQDAFLFNLVSNWRQENSEMDRAAALKIAMRELRFKEEEILQTVMPLLGLCGDKATLELYLKVDMMPQALKDLFEDGSMSFRGVSFLLQFSKADQEYFARTIGGKVKLTSSQLLQTGEWLADIMRGTGKDLRTLLKEHSLNQVLEHPDMDPRTKADKFFAAVRRIRFPGYSSYLEAFEKKRADIVRGHQDFRLEPIEGFEERGFEVRARIKSPADLTAILEKLTERHSALNSLFDVML